MIKTPVEKSAGVFAFNFLEHQRALFDCDNTEPASFFVLLLYPFPVITFDAFVSIFLPVCFPVPDWARAEAARLLAVAEDFGFRSVLDACEAILPEVCFVFFAIQNVSFYYQSTINGRCLGGFKNIK